jgi:carbamate kinase
MARRAGSNCPPLAVVALGGNAVSPPRGDLSFRQERELIDRAAGELARLASSGARLLVVHGNGPQVGRLLAAPSGHGSDPEDLDIRVAQTQGELGYLIAEALERHLGENTVAALLTRVLVDAADPAFGSPTKPIGPVLDDEIQGVACTRTPDGCGWRRVVASPRPVRVIERDAIAKLLESHHVIAGGGGGIPLGAVDGRREPRPAVIDKDWVAALLAVSLAADQLIFVTDVPHVFDRFARDDQRAIESMSADEARAMLDQGVFAPGSMAPKVESALDYVAATGRRAVITTLGRLDDARRYAAGTVIVP